MHVTGKEAVLLDAVAPPLPVAAAAPPPFP